MKRSMVVTEVCTSPLSLLDWVADRAPSRAQGHGVSIGDGRDGSVPVGAPDVTSLRPQPLERLGRRVTVAVVCPDAHDGGAGRQLGQPGLAARATAPVVPYLQEVHPAGVPRHP